MDFSLLGPVEARRGRTRVELSGSKVHTVLAAMLLARGRVISDERLRTLLWGWDPPATSAAQIYTYMSRLRAHLGDTVEITRRQPGYLLRAEGCRVDLEEFERLARSGRKALELRQYEGAGTLLREALDLWRGPALANVTDHLLEAEGPRLEEARMLALESRVDADLALGRHEEIVSELTGLVAEFPVRERLRAQLMTALYRCGRQADALQAFYDGRELLAEQLGVDPGEDLGDTYQAALDGRLALRARSSAHSAPPTGEPVMLPAAIEDFAGRDREFGDLTRILADGAGRGRRLLVTGMAGVGKTALAVRAAEETAGHYPGGRLFAELCHPDGRPKDPGEVLRTLLQALGEPATPAGLDDLVRCYRTRTFGRRLLVVLDDAAGDGQLAPLLPAGPEAAVLVTSRSRLAGVADAHTVPLGPLGGEASFRLLSQVAGADRLQADPDAADDLVAYCAGLPLALRIAGARLAARPHWPAARLAARLAPSGTRLRELAFGDLAVDRSFAASLRRLDEPGRAALARLGDWGPVGPFTATAAAAALGDGEAETEAVLEYLTDAALLTAAGLDGAERPLYGWHELIRLYAAGLPSSAVPGAVADAATKMPSPLPADVPARMPAHAAAVR
ncbi:BTAD domain-containing putative transcriptional regulator [Streptomyces boninensis]|uniref:AfsR/SARP family transcriptional regulator n=1 Tax=Streptomyces boninensis TaxID=2039455 RepID=UPI003B2216C0